MGKLALVEIMKANEFSASDFRFSDLFSPRCRASAVGRISSCSAGGFRISLALGLLPLIALSLKSTAATPARDSTHQSTNPPTQHSTTPSLHHSTAAAPPPATPREFFNAGTQK